MTKRLLFIVSVVLLATVSFAQDKFFTKTGYISFYSKATAEEINAKNKTVTTVLDAKSGALQFAVIMKGFEFEKSLMQQHFNENYVESDKYPKGDFKGVIVNNKDINYAKDGTYPAKAKGKLTIHGVTKDVQTNGTIKVAGGKIELVSSFDILLADYKITIPALVKDKIASSVKVSVECKLDPFKKP